MWTYSQSSGTLSRDGVTLGRGYSGAGPGKNNPALEKFHNVGPIPKGAWKIGSPVDNSLGASVMPLTPAAGTETYGRSGFWIHGDSKSHPGLASHGCIVLNFNVREEIAAFGDPDLTVVE